MVIWSLWFKTQRMEYMTTDKNTRFQLKITYTYKKPFKIFSFKSKYFDNCLTYFETLPAIIHMFVINKCLSFLLDTGRCSRVQCPQLRCANQYTPPGQCCPICRPIGNLLFNFVTQFLDKCVALPTECLRYMPLNIGTVSFEVTTSHIHQNCLIWKADIRMIQMRWKLFS
jgi:hypothetical protein